MILTFPLPVKRTKQPESFSSQLIVHGTQPYKRYKINCDTYLYLIISSSQIIYAVQEVDRLRKDRMMLCR